MCRFDVNRYHNCYLMKLRFVLEDGTVVDVLVCDLRDRMEFQKASHSALLCSCHCTLAMLLYLIAGNHSIYMNILVSCA